MTAYRPQIEAAANPRALSPDLVEALVLVESGGRTFAYRYEPAFWRTYMQGQERWAHANPERVAASYGLMQIMYPVALEAGFVAPDPEYLFVPAIGLEYGCRHLAKLLAWAKGNEAQALAAYNGGKGGNAVPPYRNQSYVDKVFTQRDQLRK